MLGKYSAVVGACGVGVRVRLFICICTGVRDEVRDHRAGVGNSVIMQYREDRKTDGGRPPAVFRFLAPGCFLGFWPPAVF